MNRRTRSLIDLHSHTLASDGGLSPTELVELAAERGVTDLGITDHDTTEGLTEAEIAGNRLGVRIVAGVEINCDFDAGHADVLGYLFDPAAPALQSLLADIRAAREVRARKMVEQLQRMGADIEYAQVEALSVSGSVGRPHVARALVDVGFVTDVGSAFRSLIGRHGPAYVERERLHPAEACRVIRQAGGVPSLAHPVPPGDPWSDPKQLRTFLPPLVEAGLGGLECYYSGYTAKVNRWLDALATHFGLVPTGGSDYHGPWQTERSLGSVELPADTVARLEAARG